MENDKSYLFGIANPEGDRYGAWQSYASLSNPVMLKHRKILEFFGITDSTEGRMAIAEDVLEKYGISLGDADNDTHEFFDVHAKSREEAEKKLKVAFGEIKERIEKYQPEYSINFVFGDIGGIKIKLRKK